MAEMNIRVKEEEEISGGDISADALFDDGGDNIEKGSITSSSKNQSPMGNVDGEISGGDHHEQLNESNVGLNELLKTPESHQNQHQPQMVVGGGGGDVKCDDCTRDEPIRQWRWCIGCERVLCETCAVEGHYAHQIESYSTGVRRSDEELRKVMDKVRTVIDSLTEGAFKADEMNSGIMAKLDVVKRSVGAKIDECKDTEDTFAEHLSAMAILEHEPLNAKTWIEREKSKEGAEVLKKKVIEKQTQLDGYMKRLDAVIDESARKVGEIFRDDI